MNKQGVELSWNVIIIAALGLLVLLLVAYFILSGFSRFNTTSSCSVHSGICSNTCPPIGDANKTIPSPWGGCTSNQTCCTSL